MFLALPEFLPSLAKLINFCEQRLDSLSSTLADLPLCQVTCDDTTKLFYAQYSYKDSVHQKCSDSYRMQ